MLIFVFFIFFGSIICVVFAMNINLPDTFQNWTVSESVDLNSHDALFDYINGGAEQFISYGYQHAVSKIYVKAGEPEIRVEIFDMGSSKNAYGIFSNIRYEETDEFGQGSQYVTGALFFWKSKYYISISTIEETIESIKFIREMANFIADEIKETGEKPEILKILPKQEIDYNGILYFHHYIWLNAYFYISNDNIFNINDETDAVFAKYGHQDERYFLLVIKYKNEEDTQNAFTGFIQNYFTENPDSEVFHVEDEKWMALKSERNYIVAVFNSKEENQARQLLQKTMENIRK